MFALVTQSDIIRTFVLDIFSGLFICMLLFPFTNRSRSAGAGEGAAAGLGCRRSIPRLPRRSIPWAPWGWDTNYWLPWLRGQFREIKAPSHLSSPGVSMVKEELIIVGKKILISLFIVFLI